MLLTILFLNGTETCQLHFKNDQHPQQVIQIIYDMCNIKVNTLNSRKKIETPEKNYLFPRTKDRVSNKIMY